MPSRPKVLPGNAFGVRGTISDITDGSSPQAPITLRSLLRLSCAGGCDFPARPDLSALAQPVFWSPAVDPAVLILTESPDFLQRQPPRPAFDFTSYRSSPEGNHAVQNNAGAMQLLLRENLHPDRSVAALIPLDAETPSRIEVLTRFWRVWQGQSLPRDKRITAQRRRRLRLMMRAADGRDNGASYREIAKAIYGETRVAGEAWKTSPLRDTVIGLVEGASLLIDGGYLQLLRQRRRSPA